MNLVALYFASGESFYAGTALLVLMAAISPWFKQRWMWRLRNLVACVGFALIVMACPPFSWSVDVVLLVMFAAWIVLANRHGANQPTLRWRAGVRAGLCTLLLALATLEFSHRAIPLITGAPSDHLVVIGDSISSGLNSGAPSWPTVMQQMSGIQVKNLARPGAQTMEGTLMAEEVMPEDRVVLIEIGGNDLLWGSIRRI